MVAIVTDYDGRKAPEVFSFSCLRPEKAAGQRPSSLRQLNEDQSRPRRYFLIAASGCDSPEESGFDWLDGPTAFESLWESFAANPVLAHWGLLDCGVLDSLRQSLGLPPASGEI
jgi:hypothetical protein